MRSIIFNQEMVRAYAEGRKDVTRVPVRGITPDWSYSHKGLYGDHCFVLKNKDESVFDSRWIKAPLTPGETIYIRETWATSVYMDSKPPRDTNHHGLPFWYLPTVISIRPERVQEITEEEAIREGFSMTEIGITARTCFRITWNHLYPGSWDRNDWIWRIELTKPEASHDRHQP